MSSSDERPALRLPAPGEPPHSSADPKAVIEHSYATADFESNSGMTGSASVARLHREADAALLEDTRSPKGSDNNAILARENWEDVSPDLPYPTPSLDLAAPEASMNTGSIAAFVLNRPGPYQAEQGLSNNAPLLSKRQRSSSPTGHVKRPRKPRMKGRKGEDEGFIPDWTNSKGYSLTTLEKKMGQTKMAKFLTSQGIDVKSKFPTPRMFYKGVEMRKGTAMAQECQIVHAALINKTNATDRSPFIHISSDSDDEIPGGSWETYSKLGSALEDSGEDGDGEFDLEDDYPFAAREAEATSSTLQALHQIKQAILKAPKQQQNSSKLTAISAPSTPSSSTTGNFFSRVVTVLDGLGRPKVSQKAQELIGSLVQWQTESNLVRSEGLHTGKAVSKLQAFVQEEEDYEENRSALIEELSGFIQSRYEIDGRKIATQLVDNEFPVPT